MRNGNWAVRGWERSLTSLSCVTLLACATVPLPPASTSTMEEVSQSSASGVREPALPQLAAQPRVIIPAPAPSAGDATSAQAPAPYTPTDSPLLAYFDNVPHGSEPSSDTLASAQNDAPGYRDPDAAYSGVGVGIGLGLLGLGIGLGFGAPYYYPYRYGYYGGGYGYGYGHYGHGHYGHGHYGHGGGYHGHHR
jgi:hypothetical protein